MPELRPVRTPLRQHWRRIRYQLVPVLTFCVLVVTTSWLWRRHRQLPNAVGEVEVIRVAVRSQYGGVLTSLESGPLQVFDPVQAGQTVACLGDSPAQAALLALRKEAEALASDLAAVTEQIRQEEADRGYDRMIEARRLAVDVERCRLTILGLRTEIESDRAALVRLERLLAAAREALARAAATEMEVTDLTGQRDTVLERVRGNTHSVSQAEADLQAVQARLRSHPTSRPADLAAYIEPIRRRRAAQEARVQEVSLQIAALTIRSPILGTICSILCHPGQAVQPGEDILIIAAGRGEHIVSYVREHQRIEPQVGMPVAVRPRSAPGTSVQAQIVRVGPQVEEVPPHQRLFPARMEWGLPVLISIPEGLHLRPGELVDIAFQVR